ncbi:hypothetical protein AVEN_111340-1 [Araneus ventricosus]|uniref:Histone-lysine N-methyltransferase SETMAR n=1 Tax=Araneus ventricosus TaxID=182803 RepID=A0A4Y2GKI7_ARAVE|nr:hypothetical protein AVEN_111340-1 [Araneus ventricosus]
MPTAVISVVVSLSTNGFLHSKAENWIYTLCNLFVENVLFSASKKCLKWSYHVQIKTGNFDIEYEPRFGRLIEVDCEQLKQINGQGRNVSTLTIVLELDVYQKTIVNALKRINLAFKFNRWVPHELAAKDKRKRKAACLVVLRDKRKEKILDRIVTVMKTWCTTTIQAVKEGGQHLGNQQARLQDAP